MTKNINTGEITIPSISLVATKQCIRSRYTNRFHCLLFICKVSDVVEKFCIYFSKIDQDDLENGNNSFNWYGDQHFV